MQSRLASERVWLLSPRADFWFASAGASAGLLGAILVIFWHGDREIDAFDLVLSEFHLGATYHAVMQRRLWRFLPVDVLLVPLGIVIVTYAISFGGHAVLLTSIAMYTAVWHRGRQSFGIARFYQRAAGGPISHIHKWLFHGAIYLPMLASALAFMHLSPTHYEGDPYFALSTSATLVIAAGLVAALCLGTYFFYALRQSRNAEIIILGGPRPQGIHPAEWWVVLAHAIAFGSGYMLGASNASFLFVLAVHHEVQYLHFTYAVSRRSLLTGQPRADVETVTSAQSSSAMQIGRRSDWRHAVAFSLWPVIGFAGAVAGGWLKLPWLAPLGTAGLFCHYWLDGRIWTRRTQRG